MSSRKMKFKIGLKNYSCADLDKKVHEILCGSYRNRNNIGDHPDSLSKNLALYSSTYENYIIIGNFNNQAGSKKMSNFCDIFDLTSLIKEPTCYKNPDNSPCIDHAKLVCG